MLQSKQVDGLMVWRRRKRIAGGAVTIRDPLCFAPALLSDLRTDYVIMDNVEAGRLVTDHLLQHGHRRIGHVAPVHISSGQGRLAHYHKALEACGVPYDERLVCHAPFTMDGGYQAARQSDHDLPRHFRRGYASRGRSRRPKNSGWRSPGRLALAGGWSIELAIFGSAPHQLPPTVR